MKKLLLLLLGIISGFNILYGADLKPLKNSKVNIIFIFADDWGYGDLSAHGHEGLRTPNLDKMIAEGTEFQQFNVCSPVCSSSRTAVMTGNFPSRHRMHAHLAGAEFNAQRGMVNWLDPNVVLMPKLLKEAGYKTAHYGKWHLGSNNGEQKAPLPMEYGYDDTRVFNGEGPQVEDGPKDCKSSAWTHNCVNYTIDFIEKNKNEAPFFVNLWIHESHQSVDPSPEQRLAYKDVAEPQQSYYSVITSADKEIGRLFEYLEKTGLDKNTLVIFSSDNGPESGKEGSKTWNSVGVTAGLKGQKRSLFEGGVKVPFILRLPNYIAAGEHNKKAVIASVDLLPTFCDIAGVALPESYLGDGEVITDVIQGADFKRTKPILHYWQGTSSGDNWPRLSVKTDKWKLYSTYEREKIELYDYKNDWAENNNLADKNPEIVDELYAIAKDYYKSLNITHDNTIIVSRDNFKKNTKNSTKEKKTKKDK